jgi:hypothetical protein
MQPILYLNSSYLSVVLSVDKPMPSFARTLVIAFFAFTIPLSIATYANWPAVRPYLVGDAATAEGHLLYFARRG